MKTWSVIVALVLVVGLVGCAKKARPLVPLALDRGTTPQALTLTEQGTQAYQARQFEQAKQYFSQAVTSAPQSGQAHYNYALALNALGDVDEARQHFIEAANLAPGDKTIWDSPALHQYGNPQT
jgi:Tfp pilus assembly protein PilF